MIAKKAIFFTCVLLSVMVAAEEGINSENIKNESYINGIDVPITDNPRKHNLRDRVEMDTAKNSRLYKRTQYKYMERERILGEVFDVSILQTPAVRVIRSIDTVGISPTYVSQIKLPKGVVITDVLPSFDTKVLEFEQNLIRFRPDAKTFYSGNMIISFNDGRKNYTMTIFTERYYSSECKKDDSGDGYICRRKNRVVPKNDADYSYAYNNLSTVYVYTKPNPLEDFEVISLFERMERKRLCIKQDGEKVSFIYEGITYTIERDNRFGGHVGGILYRGVGYRISSSVNSDI